MNQNPTAINTYPLHLFTVGPVVRTGLRASAFMNDTATDAVTIRVTKTAAAVVNANTVCVVPTVRVWAARPASSGPVQPNPASRYPKP